MIFDNARFFRDAYYNYKRLPELPDVPTFKELNLTDLSLFLFYSLLGPVKLPANIVNILTKALEKAIKDAGYAQFC